MYSRAAALLSPLWLTAMLATSCVDQSTTPDQDSEPCPPGERRNPITDRCEATSPQGGDMSVVSKEDLDASSPPDLIALDQHGAEDLGARDLSAQRDDGPVDMKPDRSGGQDQGEDMAPPVRITRFVALGDTGTGSEAQRRVGQAVGRVCAQRGGCEFGMLLGDNAYDSGVDGPDDPYFLDIFVTPYGHLNFPFYVVLGNHDLGGDGLGVDLDFSKGDYQVQYGQMNPQWLMPAKFYQVDLQHVWLLGLNTTEIFFGQDATQRGIVPDWIRQAPTGDWKIAFGHHPYLSNGKHGNAGSYEGLPFVPVVNGEHVESFVEEFICGQVDVYVCGHDHSLQDLVASCGTEFIVSGAGAKTTEIKGSNPAHFNASQIGFTLFEATPDTLHILFFDDQDVLLHERTLTR